MDKNLYDYTTTEWMTIIWRITLASLALGICYAFVGAVLLGTFRILAGAA